MIQIQNLFIIVVGHILVTLLMGAPKKMNTKFAINKDLADRRQDCGFYIFFSGARSIANNDNDKY